MNAPEPGANALSGGDRVLPAGQTDADYYRRLLDRLISMLSHDLRTPLSAISGWLFLLESDKLDAAGRKRALDKIRTNVDDQVRLIDDVLALARFKAGTLQLERADVDVDAVVRSAIESMLKAAAGKHVALRHEADAAAAPRTVHADAARLRRAIELIIDRSLRDASGADSRITVRSITSGSRADIAIEIADNGRGIASDALRWLIDPVGLPSDHEGGSRHGPDRCLLVAASLIEAQGGTLSTRSDGEGSGATYTITLPRVA